jgi:hypothetical protein
MMTSETPGPAETVIPRERKEAGKAYEVEIHRKAKVAANVAMVVQCVAVLHYFLDQWRKEKLGTARLK